MFRLAVLALVALLLVPRLEASERPALGWHTAPASAAAVARTEGKLLLVYFRATNCGRCNAAAEAMFTQAASNDVFRSALDSYLPLRTDASAPEHPIVDELARRKKAPVVAIYDASGAQLVLLDAYQLKLERLAEVLLAFRSVRTLVAKAAAARLAGDAANADFLLGYALLRTRELRHAAERLDRAAAAFEKRGDKESQQFAEIAGGTAWFGLGMKGRGQTQVQDVLRNSPSNAVAAEAYLQLGAMHEAQIKTAIVVPQSRTATPGRSGRSEAPEIAASTRVVRENVGQRRAAVAAYRKAYELAPAGSPAVETARAAVARLDDEPLPPRDAVPGQTLRLIAPARAAITGDAEFLATGDAAIARVDFYLDDKRVASRTKAPFRANIDVGATARARRVTARAFDAAGRPIGESVTTVNDRADAFYVTIVSPVESALNGAAEVDLDVRVPAGRTLKDVELSWNGAPIATLTQPPFRGRVTSSGEVGYLRALARLDDGTTAEATKLFNAAVAETVDVSVVTLIASVLDGRGRRMTGLTASDFVVLDEGKPVRAELRSSEDEPVTIGIAVDNSGSMAGNQLYVIRAATEVLTRGMRPQDEAFVVAFDVTPRLAHPRSKDAESLRASLVELVPRGGTSIFDGVTFALQQFQGVPGKRALIVLTDGREGSSSSKARECERLARLLGVPIYLIVPPRGAKNTHALLKIAEATGGVMHYAPEVGDLAGLADRIADELRGQYVLSFPTPEGVASGEWRSIRVSVPNRDAKVRTIEGYRAN